MIRIPRPEYPRAQLVRSHWINLNGEWEFEIDQSLSGKERKLYEAHQLAGKITVPFCPESDLSGVGFKDFMSCVWYRREVILPAGWVRGMNEAGERILLHFGAVDYFATIYVNGEEVGTHKGGYASFNFDITPYVDAGTGKAVISVCAEDDLRRRRQPAGKQSDKLASYGCYYTRTTGIWQAVWLEKIPAVHIDSFKLYPDIENATLRITAQVTGAGELTAKASYQGVPMGETTVKAVPGQVDMVLPLKELHLWELGEGRLYDLELTFGEDQIASYFGMRSVRMEGMKFLLNGKSVFQRLVLDQGFYPDGIYTAPTEEALERDIHLSLAACGPATPSTTTAPSADSNVPAEVTGPVTIEYWHNHGGDLGVWMTEKVKEFNETNGKGITVIETYQGGYGDILSKVKASYGTDVNCNLAIVGAGGIEELAGAGVFADLAGYVKRDNFDLENIPEGLRYYMQHYEGKVIEFPFLVSTTVIYYNKAYYPEEPKTLEEWVAMAKKITEENPGVYGMAAWMDMGFIQRPVVKSLGAPGLCTADGEGPAAELLGENSVLYKYLADYRSWIDQGFCHPITVTDAATNIVNAFMGGKCASFVASSASMANYTNTAKEAGIELGYCSSVGYGCQTAGLGGGGFAVMSDSTQQEIAATWEFIKFLLSDENQIEKHKVSGYLPFSYSAVEKQELKDFWAENPGFEVAFKTQDVATYNDWSLHLNAWRSEISNVFIGVLVDGSLTVEQAVKQLEKQAPVIFAD